MKPAEFERKLMRLWTTSRVPMTPANVAAFTGEPRADVEKVLDKMASLGVIELDSDDDGNLLYKVPGADRMPNGPLTVGEVMKLDELRAQVASSSSSSSSPGNALARRESGDKSVVVSGLLSFFFGPFGLLYAAPVIEAVIPIGVLVALASILPKAIMSPMMGVLAPVFAIAGVVYALRHNKNGKRTSLLSSSSSSTKLLR